jgi:hypothetical protein
MTTDDRTEGEGSGDLMAAVERQFNDLFAGQPGRRAGEPRDPAPGTQAPDDADTTRAADPLPGTARRQP